MKYIMESEAGSKAIINKQLVDYFSGTGYFCFQTHPDVVHAACEATKRFGISSATTAAFYGNNPVLLEVYEKAAQFFETEGILYYVSGCFGTPILLEGFKEEYDVIFIDEESHYSSRVATSLINKPVVIFKHRSPEDLNDKLEEHLQPFQRPIIVCDGIFPISGEMSPLPQYKEILDKYEDSIICVDDAHATGVIGEKGHGACEYFGIRKGKLISSGTLSKAMGGHGGIIFGTEELIIQLKRKSTLANACSSVPIPAAAANATALDILHHNPGMRKQLWDNVFYAKNRMREIGFDVNNTPVPIICLNMGRGMKAEQLQEYLFTKNIAVTYVPEGAYTSVPKGGAVRISIFSAHSREQIDHLVDEIKSAV